MGAMHRIRCIGILLLIVASHSVVSVHAATHAQTDQTDCALCATYADPSDAISMSGLSLPPGCYCFEAIEFRERADTPAPILDALPRGPPPAI